MTPWPAGRRVGWVVLLSALAATPAPAQEREASLLVAAMLGDSPLERDLQTLTDEIGGRPTGSPANLRAVDWAVARFREAGVTVRREPFTMPGLWLERSASAVVRGDGVRFTPRIAALPFSAGTPAAGLTLPLRDGGRGGGGGLHPASDRRREGPSC